MHELYFLIVFVNSVFVLFLGLLTFFLKMVLLAMIVFDWHSWWLPSFWLHLKKYFTLEGWPLGIYSVERWKYFFNWCFMTRENKEKGLCIPPFQQQECTVLDQWTGWWVTYSSLGLLGFGPESCCLHAARLHSIFRPKSRGCQQQHFTESFLHVAPQLCIQTHSKRGSLQLPGDTIR